jgi:TATA-binding protein-associated factor Taf7
VFVCCYETSKSMSPYVRVTHVLKTNDELASLGGKDDSPSPFVFEKIIHKKSFMAPAEITHPESAKQKKEKPPRKSAGATANKKHAAPPAAATAEEEKARDDDYDDDFGLFDQGEFDVGDAEAGPDRVPATEHPADDDEEEEEEEEEEEDDIMERIRKRARAGAANVGRRLGKMCLH